MRVGGEVSALVGGMDPLGVHIPREEGKEKGRNFSREPPTQRETRGGEEGENGRTTLEEWIEGSKDLIGSRENEEFVV